MATVALTQANFEQTLKENETVIIDFWAPWCGPCQSYGPVFEKTSEKFDDVVFAKINTEEEQELAGYFQIRSIPTTVILRDGVGVFQQSGSLPEEAIVDILGQVKSLNMDDVRKEIAEQQASQEAK